MEADELIFAGFLFLVFSHKPFDFLNKW